MNRTIVALALVLTTVLLAPPAAAGPQVLLVELTDGPVAAVPTGATPYADADLGITREDDVTILRVDRLELVVPLYRLEPHGSAGADVEWTVVELPGARVVAYSPLVVETGHGRTSSVDAPLRNGTYGATLRADLDADGAYETELTLAPLCDCPLVANAPYAAMWRALFEGLPTTTLGPLDAGFP